MQPGRATRGRNVVIMRAMKTKRLALLLLAATSVGGCRRYVKSRELAPIPPVEDLPAISQLAPGAAGRKLAATEAWLNEVEPQALAAKDADRVRLRLEASRELHEVLPLIAPDETGTKALRAAMQVAAVEHALGVDGALEIAIGLGGQLVQKTKTTQDKVLLGALQNQRFHFAETITLLDGEAKRASGDERLAVLVVLASAQRGAGRAKEARVTLQEYLDARPDDEQAKAMADELDAALASGQPLAPLTAPARGFSLAVAGARATYRNTKHRWSVRYPVDWLIMTQLADAARFTGSYLALVVPVAEGPAQAGLIITSMAMAQGDDPWPKLKEGVLRALGGTDPGAPRGKSPGKLDLPGEVAYYAGETSQQDERLRYEVWILRGQEAGYAVVLLAPVARWFEIRDEVAEALETLTAP